MEKVAILFTLYLFAITPTVYALEWAYSFVVWKGNVYEVIEEEIGVSNIGRVLGEVETKANDITGKHYGNASNSYPIGTKYYEIKGIPSDTAIAVEIEEKQWVKAEFVRKEPTYWIVKLWPFLFLILIIVVVFLIALRSKNTKKKNKTVLIESRFVFILLFHKFYVIIPKPNMQLCQIS
ncbi:hypothetical protein WAX74_17100 [Psychrobacillus sp. FJAT-51614]|uniref:DUF3592 domain-containing protein n=1 Tax=Psychrobacillus mangrovi TaxID=3117745 RepID=A0ABU8F8K4_9BACI